MGIPGLTTFLEQYSTTKYASSIWLTDCTVIVDGFNAAFYLYHEKKEPNAHKVGGDYVGFAKNVRDFFQHLKNANVQPIVVFDGAHEPDKFHTINDRFQRSIENNGKTGYNQPASGYVPVGLKTAFVEILLEQSVFHVQTLGEADDTIAYLAEKLKAPVLSSDSDFQVYLGVQLAIPFQKIEFRNMVKEGKKVFALHAKIVNLKVLCAELYKFNERQLSAVPYLGLVFGNDKCSSTAFRNLFPDATIMEKFDLFLKLVLEQECLNDFGIELVKRTGIANPNLDQEIREFALPQPPTANFGRILSGYSGQRKDPFTLRFVEVHCNGIFKQSIEIKRCKISVERKKELYFEKEKFAIAVEKLQNQEEITSQRNTGITAPSWFMAEVRSGQLSTEVLDMMRNMKVWLWPQVETLVQKPSQLIAIPILQVIAGLLGCADIDIISRAGREHDMFKIKPIVELPTVGILPRFYEDGFRRDGALIFLATFGCEQYQKFINEWPTHSRFAIITLLYFLQQRPGCSAIAVGVLLSILKSNMKSNNPDEKEESSSNDGNISTILKAQKMSKELISFYSMTEKTGKLGNYELSRVYHYCEYKAIFAHAKTLNSLLGNPFKVPKITTLNSYIVYHVHEATSTKFFDRPLNFIKEHLPKDPIGKILIKFVEFSERPTVDGAKIKKKTFKVKTSKMQDTGEKLEQLKI